MTRAYYLEQDMSKDEILELYLNLIFLGDTVYGVEQGSNYYFSKSAKDLSLAESAFLAGINHSPNNYNPFKSKNKEETMEEINNRTRIVLKKMYELDNISFSEYSLAIKELEDGAFGIKETELIYAEMLDIVGNDPEKILSEVIKKL